MTATLLPFVLEVKCKCFQIEKAMVAQSIHRERKFKWFQKYKNCFLILRWQLQNKSRWSVWHLGNKRSITCISTLNITTSKEVPHVSTGVSCIWGKTILFTSKLSASLVNNIMYKHRELLLFVLLQAIVLLFYKAREMFVFPSLPLCNWLYVQKTQRLFKRWKF